MMKNNHRNFTILSIISFTIICCSSNYEKVRLVNILDIDSTFHIDVRYATENNFTGSILYNFSNVYLVQEAAIQLANVNKYLKDNYGLRLKIYDGYRPLSVQKKMWEIVPDERYVANPAKGSKHNRGCAVDVTLVDSLGIELDMGTQYDDFTEKSHINYRALPSSVLRNRMILQEAMKKFGFLPLETEWWHFDFKDWKKYPVLDEEIK